ncbi:uncharacterized protein LOC111108372 isoform X3 [Crassostrea virginica]
MPYCYFLRGYSILLILKEAIPIRTDKKGYEDVFNFSWTKLHDYLQENCPAFLSVITATVCDVSPPVLGKSYQHILLTAAVGLHGRSQEMSLVQYLVGFMLKHGGCTERDIERLSKIGLCVHPVTLHRKFKEWQHILDTCVIEARDSWSNGAHTTYKIIGDNWDKDLLPSYRTSDRRTMSLHLFNIYAILDRVTFAPENFERFYDQIDVATFIPSEEEQNQLTKELCFILSTSIIENHPQMNRVLKQAYPKHLEHKFSSFAGQKTTQYPLGLRDCNENKTLDVIQLLKELSKRYVPCKDDSIVEPVFFGGDRLTDEGIQSAQKAMKIADTPLERLEGFVSKIEDFHRLMNFLKAIHKLTYNTQSGPDRCTVYYFRNVLNMRNVKGKVCNSFRAYKMLYYVVLDAVCLLMFLTIMNVETVEEQLPMPENFAELTNSEKVTRIDSISLNILRKWFFEGKDYVFKDLREIISNPNHPDNYWISNLQEDGRLKCHYCDNTYKFSNTLQYHEKKIHNVTIEKSKPKEKKEDKDEVYDYIVMLFRLTILLKNLDSGIDMGDGERVVRSAKYELPIYNLTNKVKYVIGSIHLTALTSGILPQHQRDRLVANRFVNVQGGKNNNISLDEYLEMLNRDSKVVATGHQTKESILQNSKDYPHLVNIKDHFEDINGVRKRKGFHHLPSYRNDVLKVLTDLTEQGVLKQISDRKLQCKVLKPNRELFSSAYKGLGTLIHRHRPYTPFRRLRDPMSKCKFDILMSF